MREIKFRAWDGKEMRKPSVNMLVCSKSGSPAYQCPPSSFRNSDLGFSRVHRGPLTGHPPNKTPNISIPQDTTPPGCFFVPVENRRSPRQYWLSAIPVRLKFCAVSICSSDFHAGCAA